MNKQNKENKRKRGCLYWLFFGYIFEAAYWVIFGWWVKPILLLNEKLKEKNESTSPQAQDKFQSENQSDAITSNRKIYVTADDLNYEDVIQRYLTTSHISVPSKYMYFEYYRAEFECMLNAIPLHEIILTDDNINRNKEINLCPNYLQLRTNTNIYKLKNFISIDVETTGLKTGGGDIIEVAAIKWENFHPVSMFTTLCKPRNAIPAGATAVNHISNEMVEHSPNFKSIVPDLKKFISGLPLVAHNAPFDLKFLYVCGLSSVESCDAYDTLQLSRSIIKDCDGEKLDSYKLSDVCEELSIYFDDAHRATTDALAAGLLFIELIKVKKSTDDILSCW